MTAEEQDKIMAEAKLRFPNGTQFKSAGGQEGLIMKDVDNLYWSCDGMHIRSDKATTEYKEGKIFMNTYTKLLDKWAVVEIPAPVLVPEVINNYEIY